MFIRPSERAGLEDPSRSGAWEEGGEVRDTKRD